VTHSVLILKFRLDFFVRTPQRLWIRVRDPPSKICEMTKIKVN
jgi:hypothetical protein